MIDGRTLSKSCWARIPFVALCTGHAPLGVSSVMVVLAAKSLCASSEFRRVLCGPAAQQSRGVFVSCAECAVQSVVRINLVVFSLRGLTMRQRLEQALLGLVSVGWLVCCWLHQSSWLRRLSTVSCELEIFIGCRCVWCCFTCAHPCLGIWPFPTFPRCQTPQKIG